MKLTRRFWLVSLILVIGVVLSSCGGNDEKKDTPIPPTATIPPTAVPTFQPAPTLPNPIDVRNQPDETQAAVWVVQGVAGLPNVDIYLNDTLIVPRMGFNAITSRALPINAGDYQFSLVQAGQTPETEGAVIFEKDVTIEASETLILVASGTAESMQLYTAPQVLDPIEAGKARVVLVNAASGIGTVDLVVDDTTRAESLEAGDSAAEIVLAEESYDFQVMTDGKLIVETTQSIRTGYSYTALLLNDAAPGTFKLVFLQGQTPPQTRVRLTHVAATIPEVAIYLDEEKALTVGISYLETLPFETLASKTYRVKVVTTGDNPETLLNTNLSLTPNRTVDLVLIGESTDLRLLQVNLDTSALPPDTTRLIIVNAIPGEAQAKAISASNREVRAQVPYGRASNPIELNLTDNALYFMGGTQNEPHVIEDPRDFNFVAGEVYTYILSPSAVGNLLLLPTDVGTDSTQVSAGSGIEPLPVDASVRVVNGLDSEGDIDISFDNVTRIDGLPRGEISSSLMFTSRVYPLHIQRNGETLYQGEVVLDAEKSSFITVFVIGSDENVVISTEPDYEGSVSLSTTLLRFIHANSTGPNLYLYSLITEGTPMPENSTGRSDLVNNLSVNSVSSVLQISAGTLQFGAMDAENGQLQFTSDPITFEGGELYDVLLMGDGEGWKIVVHQRER